MYKLFLSQNYIFCNLEEGFVIFMEKNAICHSPGVTQLPHKLSAASLQASGAEPSPDLPPTFLQPSQDHGNLTRCWLQCLRAVLKYLP